MISNEHHTLSNKNKNVQQNYRNRKTVTFLLDIIDKSTCASTSIHCFRNTNYILIVYPSNSVKLIFLKLKKKTWYITAIKLFQFQKQRRYIFSFETRNLTAINKYIVLLIALIHYLLASMDQMHGCTMVWDSEPNCSNSYRTMNDNAIEVRCIVQRWQKKYPEWVTSQWKLNESPTDILSYNVKKIKPIED